MGGSVAVDGACLTAATVERTSFEADVVPETVLMNGEDQGDTAKVRYKDIPVKRATFQIMVSADGIVKPIDIPYWN